jgi:hypothetical protein
LQRCMPCEAARRKGCFAPVFRLHWSFSVSFFLFKLIKS